MPVKSDDRNAAPIGIHKISTGIPGLDEVLGGGLAPNRLYLVECMPGSGKTTLALQFLASGRAAGERCLYVTLSETQEELEAVVASHGLSLKGIEVFELASADTPFSAEREMTLLHPWEVELGETIKVITNIFRPRSTALLARELTEPSGRPLLEAYSMGGPSAGLLLGRLCKVVRHVPDRKTG